MEGGNVAVGFGVFGDDVEVDGGVGAVPVGDDGAVHGGVVGGEGPHFEAFAVRGGVEEEDGGGEEGDGEDEPGAGRELEESAGVAVCGHRLHRLRVVLILNRHLDLNLRVRVGERNSGRGSRLRSGLRLRGFTTAACGARLLCCGCPSGSVGGSRWGFRRLPAGR